MDARIVENEKLFKQITEIGLEYYDRIRSILFDLMRNPDISYKSTEILSIGMSIIQVVKMLKYNHSYDDRYDRELNYGYFSDLAFSFNSFDEIFIHIKDIINEGNETIAELYTKFQHPNPKREHKKLPNIDEFVSKDEYDKLRRKYLTQYVDSYIGMANLKDILLKLDDRAKKLSIETYKNPVYIEIYKKTIYPGVSVAERVIILNEHNKYLVQ